MPRPKIEDARDRLLSAGLSLFAKRGLERVNSNAIARRARVGVGTFYSHFEDKYALLAEIEQRTMAGLRAARVDALRGAAADPTLQAQLAIVAAIEFAASHPEAYRITFGRDRSGKTKHRPVISESIRPTARILERLQRAGQIESEVDVELAARAYLATEVGLLIWWLEDRGRAHAQDLADTLLRLHPVRACRTRVA